MASGTRRPAADLVLVQADQAARELVELLVDGIPVLAAGALRPALQVTRQALTPEQVALVAGHIRAGFHPPPDLRAAWATRRCSVDRAFVERLRYRLP
jgi:hypothetical protein